MKIKLYICLSCILWLLCGVYPYLEFFVKPFLEDNKPYIFFQSNLMMQYIGYTRIDIMLITAPIFGFIIATFYFSTESFKDKKAMSYIDLFRFNIIELLIFSLVISLFTYIVKPNYFIYELTLISCLNIFVIGLYFWCKRQEMAKY